MRILAGDIGGTKTLLRVVEQIDGECRAIAERRLTSADYPDVLALIRAFIQAEHIEKDIAAACLGIAGPVTETASGQTANVTNLPWHVDGSTLARALGIAKIWLINDFQAVGFGIEALTANDVVVLQEGTAQPRGPRAVIGAGTGLGQGLLVWQDGRYEAIATEGGHADFAPTDGLQIQLLEFLRARFGHVACERVLSGPGLVHIYEFLNGPSQPDSTLVQSGDPAAAIAAAALAGTDPAAVEALNLFIKVYGAQAGNLALSAGATGGIFIAGGMAPKILPALTQGAFMHAFRDKGRMAPLLTRIPVKVVVNSRAGLLGAERVARRL